MKAVLKRELGSYFHSPIAYIFIAIVCASSGLYFFASCLYGNMSTLTYVFADLFGIMLILCPLLTMKIWSEDRKYKTDQALLTSPVNLFAITMGKYLSALIVYAISVVVLIVYEIIICFYVMPDIGVFLGNMLGILLLGAALIAIGMFISALTESQVIAAIGAFAVNMVLMMMDSIASIFDGNFLSKVLNAISFNTHYESFTTGILNVVDILFFVSVAVIFVFLTVRVFEKRRWG